MDSQHPERCFGGVGMSKEIEALLDKLARSNKDNGGDSNASKRIRKELRRLDHYGGLRGKRNSN
jgi:hypothetical protein